MSSNPNEQNTLDPEADVAHFEEAAGELTPRRSESQEDFAFGAMNLKVGDRLQAQVPGHVSVERCFVRLIGYLQDQSMLITSPTTVNNVRMKLIEGDQVVMRVFSRQKAFAFACDVLRVCKLPYNYLHISFPTLVQGTVIRKSARVKTKIKTKVFSESRQGEEKPGVLYNLSANGALLEGQRDLAEVGDTIRTDFKLKLHNIEASMSLKSTVRAVFDVQSPHGSEVALAHFGLEFVDLQPNDHMLLQSMVYQKMIEDPQSLV